MSEREERDAGNAARSLNVVHYIERDPATAARVVSGLLERSASEEKPSFLAILPSADDVLAFSEAVSRLRPVSGAIAPVTSLARGRRLLGAGARAIAGPPAHLAALVAEMKLSLADVRTVVLVWPEDVMVDEGARSQLESLIAEVPRTSERLALCSSRSPELAQFLERSMWKARAIDHAATATSITSDATVRALVAPEPEMLRALRTVLDAFDPVRATMFAFTAESESLARDAIAALDGNTGLLSVSRDVPEDRIAFGIILGTVPTPEQLTAIASVAGELIAIVPPSLLPALQKSAPNTTPMTWTGSLGNARTTLDALRDEVRGYVSSGGHTSWMPIVEPLLEGMDAVEVAAASLALLDRERRKAKRFAAAPAAQAPERPAREERPRPSSDRRGGERERRDTRPSRPFDKRPSSGPRKPFRRDDNERPASGARGSFRRDDERRPPRDDRGRDSRERGGSRDIERMPRAAHEGKEWSERGERLGHSRRGPRDGSRE